MTNEEKEAANFRKLPVTCYALPLPGMGNTRLIRLIRGEAGFYPADNQILKGETPEAARDRLNSGGPVTDPQTHKAATPAQVAAMRAGSIFGFHTPAADPDNYAPDGEMRPAEEIILPSDPHPPGPMTGLAESDIYAQDAAAEGTDAQRLLDEADDTPKILRGPWTAATVDGIVYAANGEQVCLCGRGYDAASPQDEIHATAIASLPYALAALREVIEAENSKDKARQFNALLPVSAVLAQAEGRENETVLPRTPLKY